MPKNATSGPSTSSVEGCGHPVERHERAPRPADRRRSCGGGRSVRGEAEEHVPEPLPDAHHHQPRRGLHQVEPAAALGHGQRRVGGDPGEEPPVAEHREGVHGGGDQAVPAQVRTPQTRSGARFPGPRPSQPDRRLRHVAADPEHEQRGQDADEEHRAPAEARQHERPRRRRPGSRRSPTRTASGPAPCRGARAARSPR